MRRGLENCLRLDCDRVAQRVATVNAFLTVGFADIRKTHGQKITDRGYKTMPEEFYHEEIQAVPAGYQVRTLTHPSGHEVRLAFPPGRRKRGSGRLIEILHPHGKANPCTSTRNPGTADAWNRATEAGRVIALKVASVPEISPYVNRQWKDLPKNIRAMIQGKQMKNSFDTAREKAAFAAGVAAGSKKLGSAISTLRSKRASRLERMTGRGLAHINPKRELSVPEKHQLKIARDTLKMPDAMVDVMGGPNKQEAREIILRLTGRPAKENPEGQTALTYADVQAGRTFYVKHIDTDANLIRFYGPKTKEKADASAEHLRKAGHKAEVIPTPERYIRTLKVNPKPVMDYKLAMAAGKDAGDRNMRAAGRKMWNEQDWNVAAETVHKLLPETKHNPFRRETILSVRRAKQVIDRLKRLKADPEEIKWYEALLALARHEQKRGKIVASGATKGYSHSGITGNPKIKTYEVTWHRMFGQGGGGTQVVEANNGKEARKKAEAQLRINERGDFIIEKVRLAGSQPNPKRNLDQITQAQKLYEEFSGKKAGRVTMINEPVKVRDDYAHLGWIEWVAFHLVYQDEGYDPRELSKAYHARMEDGANVDDSWKEIADEFEIKLRVFDFSGDEIRLAASPEGNQLYFLGGKQEEFAQHLKSFETDTTRDRVLLGEVAAISYEAKKEHLGDQKPTSYYHVFAEENGDPPVAYWDSLTKRIMLVGGNYSLDNAKVGIVN